LLADLLPYARVTALLVNPNLSSEEAVIRDVQDAARAKGMQLRILKAGTEDEIDAAFETLAQLHPDGLLVGSDPFFARGAGITLCSSNDLPRRSFTDAFGLTSYGPNVPAIEHQLGIYAGKVLKGAEPADLPVQQPTTFELVVNLKTARSLGITVPPLTIARADGVIE
jgi:putative ABC transport system substrate-binding protein